MEKEIIVRGLTKRYRDGTEALRGIDFEVEKGTLFAFLGENGAGKSTAINILATALEKTSGSVMVAGHDLDSDRNGIKDAIGIVFQETMLDMVLTVRENLYTRAFFYGMSYRQARERIAELDGLLDLKPLMGKKVERLSGGQRRRADIARGLLNHPDVLFLDEPTTGLDPKTRVSVWAIIEDLRHRTGLTVFLTTHYMEETEDADEVVILDEGTIKAFGTPHELKAKYAKDRLLWYAPETSANDAVIQASGFGYSYTGESYKIYVGNSAKAADFIAEHKDVLTDFELRKADMESVFLNATGKE